MDSSLNPDNAIAFAQFRLRGGWKNLALTAGLYALVVGGAMAANAMLAGPNYSPYSGWVMGLLGLQVALLLMFGSSRVSGAIRADLNSGMMESHRLMPTTGAQAVLGYIFGSTCQTMALFAANLGLGAYAVSRASLPLMSWLNANLLLLWFAVCLWAVIALLAFGPKGATVLVYLPIVSLWFSQGMSLLVLPAMSVFIGLAAGRSIAGWAVALSFDPYPFAVGALFDGILAAICFVGAARRFRRPHLPGINARMGVLLLATWVAASMIGIAQWDDFRPKWVYAGWVYTDVQVTASIIATLVFSLFVVDKAIVFRRDERRLHGANRGRPSLRMPVPMTVCACVGLMLTLLPLAVVTRTHAERTTRAVYMAACLVLALTAPSLLMLAFRRRGKGVVLPMVLWLFLVWMLPPLIDAVVRTLQPLSADDSHSAMDDMPGRLSCISPPAAIVRIIQMNRFADVVPGLIVHAALTVLIASWYLRSSFRGFAHDVPNPSPVSPAPTAYPPRTDVA